MSETITFPVAEALPPREPVLRGAGIPPGVSPSPEVENAFQAAVQAFLQVARPVGILEDVSEADFREVYAGEGRNEPRTPVDDVLPHARALALFAVTLGEPVGEKIRRLLAENDFAAACLLDGMASEAADRLATAVSHHFLVRLYRSADPGRNAAVLPYSPGYCGWHITGQKRLFRRLRPEQIGISLNDSCLMVPLKSVSGAAIVAPWEAHPTVDSYPFCNDCETHGCRERLPRTVSGDGVITVQR